jgi:hypothetical protein
MQRYSKEQRVIIVKTPFQIWGNLCGNSSQSVISRNGDQNLPPRSRDLTPCDFFLWGFVKSRVYANKPQTVPELKKEIRRVIGEIEPQLCGNVIENFVKRARVCQQSSGGRLSDIVFHN